MRFTLSLVSLLLGLVLATVAVAGEKEATDASTTPPIEASPPDTEVAAPASPAPAEGDAEASDEDATEN